MATADSLSHFEQYEVSFGAGGVALLPFEEIGSAQNGYAYLNNGVNLCGMKDGDWRKEWVVIGHDTLTGDPIFIDSAVKEFPVYTAPHGDGIWVPVLISILYTGFRRILLRLKHLSLGREHPVGLSENPMTLKEYNEFVRFARIAGGLDDLFFWELLVADEEAGIEPEI